jgi:hypothetical protein
LLNTLSFFDCNVAIGRGAKRELSAESLRKQMLRYGIQDALVYHILAREYQPAAGNEQLIRELDGCQDLHPCWVVLPHHTGEFPSPDVLLQRMSQNHVRSVRLFPSQGDHYYSLEDWNCGDLFTALEQARVPTLIDFDQTDWSTIHHVGTRYPRLPLIVLRCHYRVDRNLYPLLEQCPELRIEISWYEQFRAVEVTARRFGAERLLFGSAMPEREAGGIIAGIEEANLSESEKRLIAGDNMRRLLAEVRL